MKAIISVLLILAGIAGQAQIMEKDSNPSVIEVVTFRVKEGISSTKANQQLLDLGNVISSFPGYISRTLSKSENGEWIDVVYWQDLTSALNAAKSAEQNSDALEVFAIIDETSLRINHYQIINQTN